MVCHGRHGMACLGLQVPMVPLSPYIRAAVASMQDQSWLTQLLEGKAMPPRRRSCKHSIGTTACKTDHGSPSSLKARQSGWWMGTRATYCSGTSKSLGGSEGCAYRGNALLSQGEGVKQRLLGQARRDAGDERGLLCSDSESEG